VCVCETIGDPSKLSVIRKSTDLGRIFRTLVLMCEEKLLFTMNQVKTRLIDEMFASVFVVYYESRKREVKIRLLRVLGVSRRTP
jgi:hypothetical protein